MSRLLAPTRTIGLQCPRYGFATRAKETLGVSNLHQSTGPKAMSRTDRPVDLEQIRECSPGVSFWFPCQKGCCAREHYRIDRSSTDDGSCSAESESSYWALPVGPILSPQVSGKISQFLPSIHEGRFTLIDVKETQMSCELPNVSGVGAVAGTVLIPKCEDI